MSVPLARQEPELRRYPLRAVRVSCATGTVRLVAPRSASDLLRSSAVVAQRANRGEHPHWAEIWPASLALLRLLARGGSLEGRHAVDLGCGIGAAGLGAGLRGARVTFADRATEALPFAAFNARQNGVAAFATCAFDWERDALADDVDLLLLADLGYQYRAVRALLRHVDAVVARGGRVLCGDPERPTANDLFAELIGRGAIAQTAHAEDPATGDRVAIRIADLDGGAA